jgi:hypothetical protein
MADTTKTTEQDLLDQAETAVRDCLKAAPFLAVKRVQRATRTEKAREESRPDLLIKAQTPDGEQFFVVEVKRSGQPRSVREAVNQLLRYRSEWAQAYGVLAAPYISPRSAEICRKNGIGYIDLAGNCRLAFSRFYLEREGRPNPTPQRRDLRSLYSPKATRILRVLLANPKQAWKLQPLAQEAGVSLGQVFNVKKLLLDREWIAADEAGVRLAEPGPLLAEWAQNYTFRRNVVRGFYSLDSLAEIENKLAAIGRNAGTRYAFTGFSAAARLAPMVRYQRAAAYVDGDLSAVAKALGAKDVPSGVNLTLLSPYDAGVFYGASEVQGVQIVSPVQAYLDLIGYRGRGEEAATFLLEQVIQPQW